MKQDNKLLNAQIAEARKATALANKVEPRAISVRYVPKADQVEIKLSNGTSFRIPRTNLQGLENASAADLGDVSISASGEDLRWESLDVDLSVPQLLGGVFGTSRWMAALGRKGGRAKSAAKAASARANGLLGGRPSKFAGFGDRAKPLMIGKLVGLATASGIVESESRQNRYVLTPLSRELVKFGEGIRNKIKSCVDALDSIAPDSRNHTIILTWARLLGVLTWDIGGSCLFLLQHNQLRAPMILIRCLFEYQVRLRYYTVKPEKGVAALEQFEERLRRIYAADPTLQELPMSSDDDRIERENFRNEIMKTVYPKDYDKYCRGFFRKASAYVHGYETAIGEVLRDWYADNNSEPAFQPKLLSLNDTASVCVHQLLEQYRILNSVGKLAEPVELTEANWRTLQNKLGLDRTAWT